MCKVRDLKRLLEQMDDDDTVQFHDATQGRWCPINSHSIKQDGPCRLLELRNTLPRTFGL